MYPLKFENLYYEKIWGGRSLEKFRDNLPKGNIGESWDVACHTNGRSVVSKGKYKGTRIDDLIKIKGEELIGTSISKENFPLLVKIIDAKDNLSIQVHPGNEHADKGKNLSKTEIWYILEAEKGAKIVLGTRNSCTKEEIKKAIENGELEKYVKEVPAKKGQVYFIKSGLIHAIGKGILLVEVQQNSDTTYRVYDYGRGRELHVTHALEAMNLNLIEKESKGITILKEGYSKTYLCLCKEFSLELYNVQTSFEENSDKERFFIFTCIGGGGELIYSHDNKIEKMEVKMGDSLLIPASLGKYAFKGSIELLKSYVPNTKKVGEEILSEIRRW